ncbi:MAG: HAMP domain-containing protein [Hyphomonas sp.]|uniref:sensor histidine kinase n=1 Tax=Hyphomonas sp. TaxID=87 RepID=UPI0017AB3989|nr:ATP-binding protein [Hyphomonas sp.]MBA3068160.1 HAMP domain-containing protein [Hyphomonas sp.]MBU3920839.1 HAMP domain-containing histidine kinase [Alphaproteobacteria bacterium]MBU4061105.1 HAMP domain-containing histidine kinase [Alphaproteobacteria bacterium]MBU4162829.1 HAMP domain-containing histidine kinase [Alphaproteobacteria bacterium]
MKLPTHRPAWLTLEQLAKLPAKLAGRLPRFPDEFRLPIPERMRKAMPVFVRTTTFKLAMLYSLMIAAFSGALLAYLYYSTVYYIRIESERRITVEFEQLANAYYTGGMQRLSQSVFERMTLSGSPFYYYLEDTSGRKIAGHFPRLPDDPPEAGMKTVYFDFELPQTDGTKVLRPAAGRIVRLKDNGGSLMVAFDTAQQTVIVDRIQSAILVAAPVALILSLLGGVLITRGAARRAEELAKTAEAVIGGELSRRVPVRGTGDEFDRLAQRINAMLDQIGKLVEASQNTGNAIAHDLRSPLTRLRNRLELALSAPMTEQDASTTLGETVEEVDRVLDTFNAILRLARLDAGTEGLRVRMDLSEVAEELAELFDPACEEAGLTFRSQITRGQLVLGDRELIGQAISNLIDNAIKYTPQGGSISLSVTRGPEAMIDLTVLDTGPGIPDAERSKVIQRFHRMDSARTQPGSGLGLSLVQSVADLHGGELVLSDGNGPKDRPGLRATLRLPRA